MAEDDDDSSKTEEPSQKKLDEARKRGQMVSSREINHFFMMLALAFFVAVIAPDSAHRALRVLSPFITQPDEIDMDGATFAHVGRRIATGMANILMFPLLLTFVAAIAPSVVQRKWSFSAESIMPKLEKLSPLAGFKRIFGLRALVEFLKNMLKVSIIGTIVVMLVMPYQAQIAGSVRMTGSIEPMLLAQHIANKMLIAACIFLFLLSVFDYFYQRFMFMKSMRMTKQELKDEYKQQEGDPHVKGKLRAIRREKAKKRMMANVPKADVVITNPTHYSVALQYDPATMQAPKVVAMGIDDVALRIRELAAKHKIIQVRNPPLARVLYDTAEIDEDIPLEHYQAVAKVIGYVYKLRGKDLSKQPKTVTMPKGKMKKR